MIKFKSKPGFPKEIKYGPKIAYSRRLKEIDKVILRDVEGWLLGGGRVPGKRGGAGGKAGSAVGRRPSLMGGDGGLTVSESEQGKWNKMEI